MLALLGLGSGLASADGMPGPRKAGDSIEHPAPRREFTSPNGQFMLVVEAVDKWKKLAAKATLLRTGAAAAKVVWSHAIVQQLGPRQVLVSNEGRVLMIDEGINVRSRYALMLFDAQGQVLATHDFDTLARAAGATEAAIKAHARFGTWMGDRPSLAAAGDFAEVPFAGRSLRVSMRDGGLSIAR
jgi:hypothetical protein